MLEKNDYETVMSKENESLLWISGGRNFQSKEGRAIFFPFMLIWNFIYLNTRLLLKQWLQMTIFRITSMLAPH